MLYVSSMNPNLSKMKVLFFTTSNKRMNQFHGCEANLNTCLRWAAKKFWVTAFVISIGHTSYQHKEVSSKNLAR